MDEINRKQMKILFEIKQKVHHLCLSPTLSMSLFSILKTIETQSKMIKIAGEEIVAMRVNDLFDTIHVSRPAISKALKECESRGYISRFISEKDKRFSYVSLKEKGKEVIFQSEAEIKESVGWIIAQFSDEEKEHFKNLMIRINQILDDFEKRGR